MRLSGLTSVFLSLTLSVDSASAWLWLAVPKNAILHPSTQPTTAKSQLWLKRFSRKPSSSSLVRLQMSDFPSAMPPKPQKSLQVKMEESADQVIENLTYSLGEGVEPPPELEELKQARATGAGYQELAHKIYEVMIERGMRYDEAPISGILTPTEFDIKTNLDVKEVKEEFLYLYKYGMMLMDMGLLTADQVTETVKERLVKRTGLSPQEFDTWLGY